MKDCAQTPAAQTAGLINGQALLPYASTPICLGSYGKSGCTYIALYNAMQLLGRPQALGQIVREVFPYGAVLFGLLGAGPWGMIHYLKRHGICYTASCSPAVLTEGIAQEDVVVFTAVNDRRSLLRGWHSMAVQYLDGRYHVYNRYSASPVCHVYDTFEEIFREGIFLRGARIPAAQ